MEAATVLKHRRRRQRVLLEPSLSLCCGGFLSASARMAEARRSQLGGNPNPRAMQRRFGVASEEGSSSLPGLIGATRYPIGPSGLTLVRCPRCGSAVVECRSWRQGDAFSSNARITNNLCQIVVHSSSGLRAIRRWWKQWSLIILMRPFRHETAQKWKVQVQIAQNDSFMFGNKQQATNSYTYQIWQQRTSNPFRFRQRSKFSHITKGHRFRSKFRHYRFREV
uniref:Uncharacterized protein n=1 Tax=Oryza rufipogon TaxID=4529 RepID=A0A0E0PM14_ORYRU